MCADLLRRELEQLIVDARLIFARMCLQRCVEIQRGTGARNVEAVAARLVERMDGAQERGLRVGERAREHGEQAGQKD